MKKTIRKISFIAIMLCVVMLAANCKKDETTTTPPVDVRDIFIGNFHMSDSSQYQLQGAPWETSSLDIVISKNPTEANKINIMNLNKSGRTVTANISGSVFIITEQIFGNTPDLKIHGSGKFENNVLSYIYFYTTSLPTVEVRGQGTKFTK